MGISLEKEESSFSGYIDDDTPMHGSCLSIALKEKPYKDDEGKPVMKFEFKFRLIDEDGAHDGEYLWGETSTLFNDHPKCRLSNWANAIMGEQLPPGYQLDTDELLDKECRVVVGYRTWEKDGQTHERNYIKDVMPLTVNMANFMGEPHEPF